MKHNLIGDYYYS